MKKTVKSALIAIVIFAGVSIAYFLPDITQNKKLYQGDITAGIGQIQEMSDYGKKTLWTNSMFSGMPTYQTTPAYPSSDFYRKVTSYLSIATPYPANLLFLLALGSFLLFIALGASVRVAVIGAFAYTFSSYFPILIHAGHIWKLWVLIYIPPTFAGIIWAYKGKYLLGGVITAFIAAVQLAQNHVQMTYYFGILVLIYIIFEFVYSCKNHKLLNFAKASSVLIFAGLLAVAVNSTNLYHTYQYSKFTMRGSSDLVEKGQAGEEVQSKGIDRDYATQWSYGIGETFSLLVPDIKGGNSVPMAQTQKEDASALNKADVRTKENILNFSRYWGDQPFTAGPVYAGAFIMFLFLLGLFIVRGRMKWALLTATILSILLSWGHNFMWFSDLFFDYFPLYDKFRTVSSILVIAELTIPMLAILALIEVMKNPNIIFEKKNEFYIALGSTAGVCIIFILYPSIFSLLSDGEQNMLSQAMDNPQQAAYVQILQNSLQAVREQILRSDAIRSLLIILVGVGLMFAFAKKYIKANIFVGLIAVLVLLDMSLVAKRYLNSNDFHPVKDVAVEVFPETPADKQILQDDSYYRVFNLTVDPFQDSKTSYRHKSIGGYHAAKMRRYQDLITYYISKNNMNVLNMLNTKYIITDVNRASLNSEALGNAWFIDELVWVDNANEELESLATFNPATTAISDKKFRTDKLDALQKTATDSTAKITLASYAPDNIKYESNSEVDKLAVFSEIYYPHGWRVYLDGVEVDHFRVNYILRSMYIPKGKHTIEFAFHPKSYSVTETIGYTASLLILLGVLALIGMEVMKYRRNKENDNEELAANTDLTKK